MGVDIGGTEVIDISSKEELVEYISDNIDVLYPIFKDAIGEQIQNILLNDPTLTQDQLNFINTILNKILDGMLLPN